MRCKRHTIDFTSSNGVCAYCLRERLLSLAVYAAVEVNQSNKSDRRSNAGVTSITTSQVDNLGYSCKDGKKISRFSNLFRTTSKDLDPNHKPSSSSSRSWILTIFSTGHRKKQPNKAFDIISGRRPQRIYCKGMSPATDIEQTSESMEELRRTPATKTPGRKKSMLGMAFWLSPLVRVTPNCPFKRKMKCSSEFGNSDEYSVPEKPHISAAAPFCGNRSKKLVDLGRFNLRR